MKEICFRNEIFEFYIELGKYRNSNLDILKTGKMPLPDANEAVCKVLRSSEAGVIEVLVNRTEEIQRTNTKYPLGDILLSSNNDNINYMLLRRKHQQIMII